MKRPISPRISRHQYAIAVFLYISIVLSKVIWLPHIQGLLFWAADIFCFLILPILIVKMLNLPALPSYGLTKKNQALLTAGELIFFIVVTYLALFIAIYIGDLLGRKLSKLYPDVLPPLYSYQSHMPTVSWLKFLVTIYFALTAAMIEECVFRAYLSHAISQYVKTKWQPPIFILISCLSFGLIHIGTGMTNTFSATFGGFVLAWAYLKTQDLRVPMAAHALHWLL